MVFIKKTATFFTLSVYVAMYGGPDDEWTVVGAKRHASQNSIYNQPGSHIVPSTLPIHPNAGTRVSQRDLLHSASANTEHIPALQSQPYAKPVTRSASKQIATYRAINPAVKLHKAALYEDVATLHYLLGSGTDIRSLDRNDATALHWAAGKGKIASLAALLAYESATECFYIQDNEGKTPLHRAAGIQSDAILLLTHYAPRDCINFRDKQGSTPLLWAVSGGQYKAVEALLAKGAFINVQDTIRGRTALHWVIRMRNGSPPKGGKQMNTKTAQKILTLLLRSNADPTLCDFEGLSPIDWARKHGLKRELSLLEHHAKSQ